MGSKAKHISLIRIILLGLLIATGLEITVFNFRYYQSVAYRSIQSIKSEIFGLTDLGEGHYLVSDEGAYIEYKFPFQKLENVHIDIQQDKDSNIYTNGVKVELFVTDEGNHFYYGLPEKLVVHDIMTSQYIKLHCSGKANQLKVVIDTELAGNEIIIHDLSLNVTRPFYFSKYRLLLVWFFVLSIFIFRPSSEYYKYNYDWKYHWQKVLIGVFVILQVSLFSFLIIQSNYSKEPNSSPYVALARAFAKGKLSLDEVPDEKLVSLDNPYDPDLRKAKEVDYLWDYAYYKGEYYVYFGVVPAIVFYLPYYLITGMDFPLQIDIHICAGLYVVGTLLLMHQIIKRYFKSIPFILFILISAVFINGSGILYVVLHPNHYTIPIMMALLFSVVGLYFWLSSISYKRSDPIRWRLFMGSVCIAAIAGCRPQMVIVGFLAIPILGPYLMTGIKKEGYNFKYLFSVLAFLVPIIVIASLLMYYNFARFGSVLDFGANYNLTTNDMTRRGFVLERTGFGVFTFLLQPPTITAQFPYLTKSVLRTEYMGRTITEDMYGGLLASNLFLFCGLLFYKVKNELKEKKLLLCVIMSLIFGLIIVIADVQMAGILPRYLSDCALFFFLSAILVIYTMYERVADNGVDKVRYFKVIVLLSVSSLLYNFATIFAGSNIRDDNLFYQKIANLIQFWR